MNIAIREASLADMNLLSELGAQTFSDSFAGDNTPANMESYLQQAFNKDQIRKELEEEETQFFIAFDKTVPAGYAKLRKSAEVKDTLGSNAIELQRIYVVKNYQGKKVGAALLQACLDYVKAKKYQWIWLGVWERNFSAQRFYEKWGFEKFDEHVFQMGDDPQVDWLMRKSMNA